MLLESLYATYLERWILTESTQRAMTIRLQSLLAQRTGSEPVALNITPHSSEFHW
jgi:hypothetical protein